MSTEGKLLEVGKLRGAIGSSMSNLSNSDNSGSSCNHHALQHHCSSNYTAAAAVAATGRFSNVNMPTATDDDRQKLKLFIHQC